MKIVGITGDQMQKLWPTVRPYFESFASRSSGRHSAETLRRQVVDKNMQCWLVEEDGKVYACGLTEIVLTDTGQRWGHLGFLAGKERKRWLHLADEFIQTAKDNGLDGFTVHCRKGWSKFLASKGLTETHVVLEAKF